MSMTLRFFFVLLVFFFISQTTSWAQNTDSGILTRENTVLRAQANSNTLYLDFKFRDGWHTYWKNPGDSGFPVSITPLNKAIRIGEIRWPIPTVLETAGIITYGFENTLFLEVPYQGEADDLHLKLDWLVCADVCIPEGGEIIIPVTDGVPDSSAAAEFPVKGGSVQAYTKDGFLFIKLPEDVKPTAFEKTGAHYFLPLAEGVISNAPQGYEPRRHVLKIPLHPDVQGLPTTLLGLLKTPDGVFELSLDFIPAPENTGADHLHDVSDAPAITFFLAIIYAFLGGIILNLMPCVFPVLSIKALSLIHKSGKEDRLMRRGGMVFTLGVLMSFLSIAGVLLALKSSGEAVGWGFQLQSPAFITLLSGVLLYLALSLSGVVSVGTKFMGIGQKLTQKSGDAGNFFTGVLAVVVATPCTAPFMAGAIGYTVTQPAFVALAVFAALGLGLAFPFLVLTHYPVLLKRLPKPGAWMNTFKHIMAIPLYLTVIWLLWVLKQQIDSQSLAMVLLALTFLIAQTIFAPRHWVTAFIPLVVLTFFLTAQTQLRQSYKHGEVFSPARLAQLRAENRPVFVNATAAWCITCLVNERVALSDKDVQAAFQDQGIIVMVADWTNRNAEIRAYLNAHGRDGVPLYVFYPAGGDPEILPQILTPGIVLNTLGR